MKQKLNPNITRKEFEALARRKPGLDGDWLYRHEAYSVEMDHEQSPLYPKFELYKEASRLFRSFEDAESYLRKSKPGLKDLKFYCHYITQIPMCERENITGTRWMYDGEKNLIDHSLASWGGKTFDDFHYFGRPKELMRFRPGEIVEVRSADEVRLALLLRTSPDVEWCWQYLQRCKSRKYGDETTPYMLDPLDDFCYILDGPNEYYHDHVSPLCIMKPHLRVPDDIRATMESWVETFNKQELDREQPNRPLRGVDSVGEFGALQIEISGNTTDNIPRLHIVDGFGLKVGLRIDKAEYHDHDDYCGRLTESQVKALVYYLSHSEACRTNWWYMLRRWNEEEAEDGYRLPLNTPLPDYSRLINQT